MWPGIVEIYFLFLFIAAINFNIFYFNITLCTTQRVFTELNGKLLN